MSLSRVAGSVDGVANWPSLAGGVGGGVGECGVGEGEPAGAGVGPFAVDDEDGVVVVQVLGGVVLGGGDDPDTLTGWWSADELRENGKDLVIFRQNPRTIERVPETSVTARSYRRLPERTRGDQIGDYIFGVPSLPACPR